MNRPLALQVGVRIRRFCASAASYAVLDRTEAKGGTWTSGGCALLALALQRALGHGTPTAIIDGARAQHVALHLDDYLIDADGAATPEKLLKDWRRSECCPMAHWGEWNPVAEREIPCSPRDVTRVFLALRPLLP